MSRRPPDPAGEWWPERPADHDETPIRRHTGARSNGWTEPEMNDNAHIPPAVVAEAVERCRPMAEALLAETAGVDCPDHEPTADLLVDHVQVVRLTLESLRRAQHSGAQDTERECEIVSLALGSLHAVAAEAQRLAVEVGELVDASELLGAAVRRSQAAREATEATSATCGGGCPL